MQTRPKQLLFVISAVVLLTSGASHLTMRGLHIDTVPLREWAVDPPSAGIVAPAEVMGSSLTFYGISVKEISEKWRRSIVNLWIPSASPCELEQVQGAVPGISVKFVGISLYDQDEDILCDYRSELVPLSTTIADLWRSDVHWSFAKRVLAQYTLKYVRWVFPTSGRSLSVLVALKARMIAFKERISGRKQPMVEADTRFDKPVTGSLAEWSAGQLADQVAILKTLARGKHQFNGPKRLALERLIANASPRQQVVILVLPVSPSYRRLLLSPTICADFEKMIEVVKSQNRLAKWLRLDQGKDLDSDAVFYDLAHMNEAGKKIATSEVLRHLREFSLQ